MQQNVNCDGIVGRKKSSGKNTLEREFVERADLLCVLVYTFI